MSKTVPRTVAVLAAGLVFLAGGAARAEPGVTDTEIRIGDVNILTGPASFIGQAVSVGSKVAAREINDRGGINGRKIVILTEDDGYVPARSFQAAKKLIEVDQVFALNGTSGTANVLANGNIIAGSAAMLGEARKLGLDMDPVDTRNALGIAIAASLNAPIGEPRYGVLRL
ncbi:MAG TPA: ABC transporter substrate-binding protein [Azospirillum sp.]|nr:ABC transporter substrate-binding protein [Azospirillum sp.]